MATADTDRTSKIAKGPLNNIRIMRSFSLTNNTHNSISSRWSALWVKDDRFIADKTKTIYKKIIHASFNETVYGVFQINEPYKQFNIFLLSLRSKTCRESNNTNYLYVFVESYHAPVFVATQSYDQMTTSNELPA